MNDNINVILPIHLIGIISFCLKALYDFFKIFIIISWSVRHCQLFPPLLFFAGKSLGTRLQILDKDERDWFNRSIHMLQRK
jgi:hypothetical protein